MKVWQKSALITAGSFLLLSAGLQILGRWWWYPETIWYRALMWLNVPPAELSRLLLHWLEIPRIYDIPLTWRETLVINSIQYGLAIPWWCLLGAAGSVAWRRIVGRFRR